MFKKDRNAFFGDQMQGMGMPPGMMQMQQGMMNPAPYNPQFNPNTPGPMMPNTMSQAPDYGTNMESRLAKLERQITRLETRVNKLETTGSNTAIYSETDIDINNANSMYMV